MIQAIGAYSIPRTVGIFAKDKFLEAGDKGLVVSDLLRGLRNDGISNATYHSFTRYVYLYRRLGYIVATGQVEPSRNPALEKRVYYRITARGKAGEWSNPQAKLKV